MITVVECKDNIKKVLILFEKMVFLIVKLSELSVFDFFLFLVRIKIRIKVKKLVVN